jgi:hypothetical protein
VTLVGVVADEKRESIDPNPNSTCQRGRWSRARDGDPRVLDCEEALQRDERVVSELVPRAGTRVGGTKGK